MTTFMATGLTGINIFVRPEERTMFEALKRDLAASLSPKSAHERYLFDVALSASWNVRRCIGLEAEIQNEANSLGFADAYFEEELARKLDRVNRYKRQYESSYRNACKELRQLAAARPELEPEPQPELEPAPIEYPDRDDSAPAHEMPSTPETPRRR